NCRDFLLTTNISAFISQESQVVDDGSGMGMDAGGDIQVEKHYQRRENICTVYDFYAGADYYTSQKLASVTKPGAALGASYASTPAPTFRHTVEAGAGGQCPGTAAMPPAGHRFAPLSELCVGNRDAGSATGALAN